MGRTGGVSRRNFLAALPWVGAWPSRAQNATFSGGVKVVNLFATVRDKQGAIVRGLTKGDFVLQEDRRPQLIRYFSQESDLPLTLGLLVDVSGSQRRLIPEERTASFQFFDQVLREDLDRGFVIHFQGWVELLQNLTSSRDDLERSLRALSDDANQFLYGWDRGGLPGGGRGPRSGFGTALYDAVWLASEDLMKKEGGRKALVILTDGVDTASMMPLEAAVESAQRADTLIYSVLFEDPDGYNGFGRFGGFGPDGRPPLDILARQTGGRLLEVNKKRTLEQVYDSIQEELRSLYSIGYTPDRETSKDAYHKIKLSTREKGLVVQTRDGYYDG